jgi:hypothetical protein
LPSTIMSTAASVWGVSSKWGIGGSRILVWLAPGRRRTRSASLAATGLGGIVHRSFFGPSMNDSVFGSPQFPQTTFLSGRLGIRVNLSGILFYSRFAEDI